MWTVHAARRQSWSVTGVTAFPRLFMLTKLYAVWRQRARTRQDLLRLNDHYLHDVGLTRSQVMIECNKPFWRA